MCRSSILCCPVYRFLSNIRNIAHAGPRQPNTTTTTKTARRVQVSLCVHSHSKKQFKKKSFVASDFLFPHLLWFCNVARLYCCRSLRLYLVSFVCFCTSLVNISHYRRALTDVMTQLAYILFQTALSLSPANHRPPYPVVTTMSSAPAATPGLVSRPTATATEGVGAGRPSGNYCKVPFSAYSARTSTRSTPRFGTTMSHQSFFSRHNPHPHRVRHLQGEAHEPHITIR